jgi:hypothetical protein
MSKGEPLTDDDGLGGRADEVYAALLAAHEGLSEADSRRLDARLVLLLANAVGDVDRVLRVLEEARGRGARGADDASACDG